jgi:hypothetical protein
LQRASHRAGEGLFGSRHVRSIPRNQIHTRIPDLYIQNLTLTWLDQSDPPQLIVESAL